MSATASTDDGNDNDAAARKKPRSLFLFDFDGVVCDSCDECTVSALRTLQKLKAFDDDDDENKTLGYPPPWLFEKMREIRPAIYVGWQIPVLLSVFLRQEREPDESKRLSVDEIVDRYQELVDDWLRTHQKTEDDMIEAFGSVRDEWIRDDFRSWLDINKFYDGVPNALKNCRGKSVLVTTKQQRFAIALCRHAGVTERTLPNDLIYGLGQYKNKPEIIRKKMLEKEEEDGVTGGGGCYKPTDVYFFEDRWPTLAKCLKDESLNGVNFHLCSWGYVSKNELALAEAEPRVKVLTLREFSETVSGIGK